MEWSNDLVLEFIDLYEKQPVLWDQQHPQNKVRNSLNEAWLSIAQDFSIDVTVEQLRKKKESLMAIYRAISKKIKQRNVPGNKYPYTPSWFAYDAIHRFMGTAKKRIKYTKQMSYEEVDLEDEPIKDELFIEPEDLYDREETYDEYDPVDEPVPVTPNITMNSPETQANVVNSSVVRKNKRKSPFSYQPEFQTSKCSKSSEDVLPVGSNDKPQTGEFPDGPSLYAQLLAAKLRNLSERNRLILQNKIDNLVFEAELKEFDSLNGTEYESD